MRPNSAIFRQWNFDIPIAALAINLKGDRVAAAMADGSLRVLHAHPDVEQPTEITLHKGVSLSLEPDADGHAFLSGGDDGKVFIIDPDEAPTQIAEHKNQWIDHVAGSVEGHRAYSCGKKVYLLNDEGKTVGAPRAVESSVGGLAFSPNGKRLAVSHYNGISLYWTNSKETAPVKLMWKGSHLGLVWAALLV